MTREESIALLNEQYETCKRIYDCSADQRKSYPNVPQFMEALGMALTALRPVSRERVEKMRSRWVPLNNTQEHFCESCGVAFNLYAYCKNDYQFCPACGAPITDEAVEMVMERLEALHENRD